MKKIFILFLCSVIYLQAVSQLKEIFYDDFSTNKNDWIAGEIENLSVKVADGKYIVDNSRTGSIHLINRIGIDTTKNFEISISVNSISVHGSSFSGLYFGANTEKSFGFVINTNGEYGLFEDRGSTQGIRVIIPITQSKYLKKGINVDNRLKLQKTGKKWTLFINDSLVNSVSSTKFYGPFIGVYSENMKTEYDDLKVSGTSIATSGDLCTLFPLIFQSAKNNFEYIKGEPSDNDDTTTFKLSTRLQEDQNAEIFYNITPAFLYAILKSDNISMAEAIKYNDNLVLQMKKCLPGFVFTKSKDKDGQAEYIITEKTIANGTQPKVVLGISKSFFFTTISIYSVPVKKVVPAVVVKPVPKEIIPEVKKPTSGWIVNDDFRDNQNNWLVDSTGISEHSINIGYYLSTKTSQPEIILNTFRMPDNDLHDYKMETTVHNFNEKDNSPFGLVFGNQAGHAFYFLITNNGTFAIKETSDTVVTVLKNFTYSSAIHASDKLSFFNTLTIIKIKDKWSFRINNREVYNCPARRLGEKFGYWIPGNALLIAGSFKIYDWTIGDNFPNEPKEVIYQNKFYDNFRTNKNDWGEIDDEDVKSNFITLDYRIRYKSDKGFYMPSVEIPSSALTDFRYELHTSHKNGVTDKQYGMCFGKKDIDNAFIFTIAANGTYEIGKFIDGDWTLLANGEAAEAIYKNDYSTNTLAVEQTKGKWNFYINHKLIHTLYSKSLPGKKAGCYVEGKQEIGFDYISYSEIEYRE